MRSVLYMERCCMSCGSLWIVKRDGEVPPCPYCRNAQLQRGIDAAERDRQKAVNDAAKLQVRCAELEIERAQLKAIIAEVAP